AVASLAGVPKAVITTAKNKLAQLEQQRETTKKPVASLAITDQMSLIPEPSEVELLPAGIDPDELTPRQALEALYRIKKCL
ncbi:hypothetical protein, partial [Bacillus cereus group sp. BC329]|uniref:hypothetical protein n=1 Tax=Bacillus cereus group sp. BC329 TaxID=3445307 RepID=UPI003F698B04